MLSGSCICLAFISMTRSPDLQRSQIKSANLHVHPWYIAFTIRGCAAGELQKEKCVNDVLYHAK